MARAGVEVAVAALVRLDLVGQDELAPLDPGAFEGLGEDHPGRLDLAPSAEHLRQPEAGVPGQIGHVLE